jgi:hypothetical protein
VNVDPDSLEGVMSGSGRLKGAFVVAAALFGVAIAIIAYNIGVSDGAVAGGTVPVEAARRVQWAWHGAGILWPLGFLLFWTFLWGGCGRRRFWYGSPYGYGGGPHQQLTPEEDLDAWHRRAHDGMKENGSADDPGRRG